MSFILLRAVIILQLKVRGKENSLSGRNSEEVCIVQMSTIFCNIRVYIKYFYTFLFFFFFRKQPLFWSQKIFKWDNSGKNSISSMFQYFGPEVFIKCWFFSVWYFGFHLKNFITPIFADLCGVNGIEKRKEKSSNLMYNLGTPLKPQIFVVVKM